MIIERKKEYPFEKFKRIRLEKKKKNLVFKLAINIVKLGPHQDSVFEVVQIYLRTWNKHPLGSAH